MLPRVNTRIVNDTAVNITVSKCAMHTSHIHSLSKVSYIRSFLLYWYKRAQCNLFVRVAFILADVILRSDILTEANCICVNGTSNFV